MSDTSSLSHDLLGDLITRLQNVRSRSELEMQLLKLQDEAGILPTIKQIDGSFERRAIYAALGVVRISAADLRELVFIGEQHRYDNDGKLEDSQEFALQGARALLIEDGRAQLAHRGDQQRVAPIIALEVQP
jgi:hypothetical protein